MRSIIPSPISCRPFFLTQLFNVNLEAVIAEKESSHSTHALVRVKQLFFFRKVRLFLDSRLWLNHHSLFFLLIQAQIRSAVNLNQDSFEGLVVQEPEAAQH
jgi:hypothetical protein